MGFRFKDFFPQTKNFGAPGGPTSAIFAAIAHDPLNFEVNTFLAPPDPPYMSKNGQICYFQHFLGVQWKKLPQSTGLPWQTLTPKILPNFVLLFSIYCHYAISFWDFKTHRDDHNHSGRHRSPEFFVFKNWLKFGKLFFWYI